MYLVNFKLLESSKLINDHLKIESLKIKFDLGTAIPYDNMN
jgi:hypothetical protein